MSGGGPPFSLGVETHHGLDALVRALRAEEDGKELRKDLAKNMREALKPGAQQAKSSIMAMPSGGIMPTAPALRSSIARKIRPEVKLGGRWSGARVKAFKTKNIRNFPNAPKRTNRAAGWRHPVFGNRDQWVTQRGKVEWFDRAFQGHEGIYKAAVEQAMEDMAQRIASRAR
jgi:gas vesicle protein